MGKKDFGAWVEGKAAEYLRTQGWLVLERNVHFREGELDIVAERNGVLGFVEVKGRRSEKFGSVVEALTTHKLVKMRRAIWLWREARGDRRPGRILFLAVRVRGEEMKIEEFLVE